MHQKLNLDGLTEEQLILRFDNNLVCMKWQLTVFYVHYGLHHQIYGYPVKLCLSHHSTPASQAVVYVSSSSLVSAVVAAAGQLAELPALGLASVSYVNQSHWSVIQARIDYMKV